MSKLVAYHPVIHLPPDYEVYDFTRGYDPHRARKSSYGIGRYDEARQGMYDQEIFAGTRHIHMGIDIAAPVNTPVHAFAAGEVFLFGNNAAPGDYGFTLITHHEIQGRPLWALHGHLSTRSVKEKCEGQKFQPGDIIAWVGDRHENGGWNPHLHFQLSWERPQVCDMPGVVSAQDHAAALLRYPDPRLVLGSLY
ncbi:MAG: peptidoglycan DD-metalloendopeptidase family protein [Bdellovibrionales bacterium]|nr:peptidoglycan DD-metalloendopeptidase family protein [Bdellovibrionales bacterium]